MLINKTIEAKNINKSICIIGGGIAGLSAAVFLAEKGFKVTLIESSPKLGGRAYSFFDKNLNTYLDNGQHIFASWYKNLFDFLKIIGTFDKLWFQDALMITFIDSDAKQYNLNCSEWRVSNESNYSKKYRPYSLFWGIFTYSALSLKDKLCVLRLIRYVKSHNKRTETIESMSVSELFRLTKQTERIIDYFWKPFVIATFNSKPEEISVINFIKILKIGLFSKNASNLVFPEVDLNSLYVNPAVDYIKNRGGCILDSTSVLKFNVETSSIKSISLDNESELIADFIVSTVPYYNLKVLFGDKLYSELFCNIDKIKDSPILNIYHNFENKNEFEPLTEDFAGLLNSPIQWIFKNSKNRINLVISSAGELINMDKNEIIELSKKELIKCLPGFQNVEFTYSRVVKEKRATFLPNVDSLNARPGNKTKFNNLFIAGDWTDTGYPATLESAVTSAKNCTNEIITQLQSY